MKSRREQATLILVILGVTGAVALIGYFVDILFGSEWFSLLNIAVSAALTAALVILYFRQSTILESQRELLEAEMNRGVREQHTETLRERIRDWHGNPDRETGGSPIEGPSKNLPSVGEVSFSSAPSPNRISFGPGDDEFRVMSHNLEDDRYMEDLLNNHAQDLKEQADRVKELESKYDCLRGEFREEFDYGYDTECGEFSLKPREYLSLWFFEHLIRLERGSTEDFSELRERMLSEAPSLNPIPNESTVFITAEATKVEESPIYAAHPNINQNSDWREHQSELTEGTEKAIKKICSRVENDYPFETVRRAAGRLGQGASAVRELEHILIEYDGKPIYQGDCEYLQEARIEA